MKVRAAGCLRLFLFGALLLLAVVLLRAPIFSALGNFLVADQPPAPAGAVIVFGGDDQGTRIVKAAQLVQAGFAPYAIVSGPPNLLGPESDMTMEFARRQGYPPSLFQPLPNQCESTKCEAILFDQELKRRKIHSVLLVTSNYHTHRAGLLLRRQAPWLQVRTIAAPDRFFTPDGWWKTRGGQKQFLYEAMKTLSAWVGN